jgi:hypothetical protein
MAVDLGAAAIVSNAGVQATTYSTGMSPEVQTALALVTLVLSVCAIVYGAGRIVERFTQRGDQARSKLTRDDKRFEDMAAFLNSFKDEIMGRFNALEKDLIGRRATVDLKVAELQWLVTQMEKQNRLADSRERKNLRKLEHLETRMSPWLKEYEPDNTRSIATNFQRIDDEEATDDGTHG